MDYIKNKTDFYTAPASTQFHLSCEGGLLQHSLNVYDCLVAKKESPIWKKTFEDIPEDWTCPACGVGKEHFEKYKQTLKVP